MPIFTNIIDFDIWVQDHKVISFLYRLTCKNLKINKFHMICGIDNYRCGMHCRPEGEDWKCNCGDHFNTQLDLDDHQMSCKYK